MGDLDHADAEWQAALRLQPGMIEAERALASLAAQKNDMAGLEHAASEIIRSQPGAPDGYGWRAFSLMGRNQFPAAEQDARKAIEVAPQAPDGYLEMGNLNALEHRFPEAENWYKQALSHDANSVDALRGLVNLYVADKQPDKAIAAANAQIALSPKNSVYYDLLGSVELDKQDYKAAERALTNAVELDNHSVDAIAKLGTAQAAMGNADQALATCENGLKNNPKAFALYMLMGKEYESKRDLERAKTAYQNALQVNRDEPVASNNLAYLLL